ncbi:uncharacterized [Tachysurus ichikawai]
MAECPLQHDGGMWGGKSPCTRCSEAPRLTVMNGAPNGSKHFISASSVFIRQLQPLAWSERFAARRTAAHRAQGVRLCL